MKKLNLIFAIIFLQSIQSNAQVITFEKTYGGPSSDFGYSVQQTDDGGYIIGGVTRSFGAGSWDVYLVKTDANGDTLWTKTYGGISWDDGYSVQQTDDGGYIIGGVTRSFGAGPDDVYLVKTDANGDTLWTKTYGGTGGDLGNSVQQTDDGGYIIAGYTESFGAGQADFYLVKTDANGDTLWTKTFGGTSNDLGYSVQQTDDGGYIIGGYTESFGAGLWDVYLVRTDANGGTLWTKTFGGDSFDLGRSVQQTDDGGYIIGGFTYSFGAGGKNVYLVKTDANGDTLWTKTFGGTSGDGGTSVQQTDDGGYIIAGDTWSFEAGGFDVYLVKTNANGDTLWTKTFGGTSNDEGTLVQQTDDGGYIIAGYTYSFGAGGSDVYLIKTDSLGNVGEVGIEEEYTSHYPVRFWIAQNYPNPFNPATTIEFSMPTSGLVTLTVYDVLARKVETILNQRMDAGTHNLQWDARNVPTGIYFVKMVSGEFSQTRKMALLK